MKIGDLVILKADGERMEQIYVEVISEEKNGVVMVEIPEEHRAEDDADGLVEVSTQDILEDKTFEGDKMIAEFVDSYGDDILPRRTKTGELVYFEELNAEDMDKYRDAPKYDLPPGTRKIFVEELPGEVCACCGGGEIRVNFLGARGEVIKAFNQWLG